jgi:23S rRNA-/tRNA-specific pseudouridylate synthase
MGERGPEPAVVWADDALVVIDKPAGVPTQPDAERRGGDLLAWVVTRWPDATLVHRLDQPASGLVVFARSEAARRSLSDALQAHRLDRRYRAVLAGGDDAWGETAAWTWRVDGRPARTDVRRVGAAGGLLAVEAALHTGRTHQIRQHAATAGTPILGDRRYGGDAGRWHPRLALHAWRLTVDHPERGPLTLEASLPDELAALWARAGGPA